MSDHPSSAGGLLSACSSNLRSVASDSDRVKMMQFPSSDEEREAYFEAARAQAQKEYEENPQNVQALMRWGGALLELAHYNQGEESFRLVEEAITRLKKCLELDSKLVQAEWVLGNAYTSLGFLIPDRAKAASMFTLATASFQKCVDQDSKNELYRKALEMSGKAPDLWEEIQSSIKFGEVGGESSSAEKGASAASGSDFWWDVAGWTLLGAVIVGVLLMSKGPASPPTK